MVYRSRMNLVVLMITVTTAVLFGRGSIRADEITTGPIIMSLRTDGAWIVVESSNFRCRCQLPEGEARRLAESCEIWRNRLRHTWISRATNLDWQPKCDVCVHPDQTGYNRILNRPGDSSVGTTRMNFDQGRAVFRRIDIRADAIDWSNAALPHELTHLVLGERFGGHALPRWADEGIAMLSESPEKHRVRLASLKSIIGQRQTMTLSELVHLDRIPAPRQRDAFYGQSVALTSWLVSQSSPAQFADFIEQSQQQGIAVALKQRFHIDGLTGLQQEWDRWTRTPESIDFVSLQLHIGVDPIIASIQK